MNEVDKTGDAGAKPKHSHTSGARRRLVVGCQSSLADLPPAGAIPSLVISHFHVSTESVFILPTNNRQHICPKLVVSEGSAHQEGIFCAWKHQHAVIENTATALPPL
jgi:hypothetical protein